MLYKQKENKYSFYTFENNENKEYVYSGNSGLLIECNDRVKNFLCGDLKSDEELEKYFYTDFFSKRYNNILDKKVQLNSLTLDFSYRDDSFPTDISAQLSVANLKDIQEGLRFILQNLSHKDLIYIQFFGNQFITNFSLIKGFIENLEALAEINNVTLQFVFNTDTISLSEEIFKYLIEKNFILIIHINACTTENIFSECEISSIQKSVNYVSQYNKVIAKLLFSNANIDLVKYYKQLLNVGLDNISIQLADNALFEENDIKNFQYAFHHFSEFFIENIKQKKLVKMQNYLKVFKSIDSSFNESIPGFHCRAGISDFRLDLNGSVYLCGCYGTCINHKLCNDYSQLNSEKVHSFAKANNILSRGLKCQNCWARYLCGGTCYYELCEPAQNNKENQCFFKMEIIKNALYIYSSLNHQQRTVFGNIADLPL